MKEKAMFADCFNLMKKYYNVSNDKAYWAALVEDTTKLEKKHNDKFASAMLKAITERLVEMADGG